MISAQKQRDIIDALRRGTVPRQGLEEFAVGILSFADAIDDELDLIESGGSVFKAVRGEYGSGKTFFSRWLQERARKRGFASSEVQISETDTPLHRLETVYRRLMERLSVSGIQQGAFRNIVDSWFFTLEEDVLSSLPENSQSEHQLFESTTQLMEKRLKSVSKYSPAFTAALRGYRRALLENNVDFADGLISWLAGQPHVAAKIKRFAGIKGDLDHFGALNFLQGLLMILKDSGYPGLILTFDETETLQRVRSDVRERGLNALRQLIDEIDAGRFPGLYLMITGTPMFFDGPQGVQRLTPLAQRLYTDFSTDSKFDNPRAVQLRLRGFNIDTLLELGKKIRDIYSQYSKDQKRILDVANDTYIERLAKAVTGKLGGQVGIAPRLFLKKLVGDILDRIDQFPDFDPVIDYSLTVASGEMNEVELNASGARDVDDIPLKI